jgi:hypothetical protein
MTVSNVFQLFSKDKLSTSELMENVMDKKFISSNMRKHKSFHLIADNEKFFREILNSQRRMSMDDGSGSSGPVGFLPINPFPFLFIFKGYKSHYGSLIDKMTVISNKRLTGNP